MHTYARIIHHVSKYNLFVLQIKSIFYEWIIDLTIHVTALNTCTCIYTCMYACRHWPRNYGEYMYICIYNTTRAHIIEFLLNVTLKP